MERLLRGQHWFDEALCERPEQRGSAQQLVVVGCQDSMLRLVPGRRPVRPSRYRNEATVRDAPI